MPNFSNSSLKILLNRQNFQFFIKRQTGVFGILRHCLAKYWSAICQPRLGQWFQMAKPRATTSASDEKIDYFTKIYPNRKTVHHRRTPNFWFLFQQSDFRSKMRAICHILGTKILSTSNLIILVRNQKTRGLM